MLRSPQVGTKQRNFAKALMLEERYNPSTPPIGAIGRTVDAMSTSRKG
jgi:hypothetical protein